MTIVDKDEESHISDTKNAQAGGPPSYADATSSASASTSTPARKPPCNYLYITEQNGSIKGSWVVDPDLSIPLGLRPTVPEGAQMKNLQLYSHNGSVTADVSIVGDQPGKALIETRSHNGSVKFVLTHRSISKKVSLTACSHNGSVSVYIPRDFTGPISFKNGNGSTSFSSAVEERLTVFSRQGKQGSAYLGDWANSGYGEAKSKGEWDGDELTLESKNGKIRVLYNDDEEASSSGGGLFGWVSKLFGGDQGSSRQSPQADPHASSSSTSYPAGATSSFDSSPVSGSPEDHRASSELPKGS